MDCATGVCSKVMVQEIGYPMEVLRGCAAKSKWLCFDVLMTYFEHDSLISKVLENWHKLYSFFFELLKLTLF